MGKWLSWHHCFYGFDRSTLNPEKENNFENPASSESMADAVGAQSDGQRQFICGVIEGFYGRPWTTEQRKDLFRKLKSMGMGSSPSYMYAPKDDYKHRAFWRELYTVEEADHLSSG